MLSLALALAGLVLALASFVVALRHAVTLWHDVRIADARTRREVADLEAERHRAPIQEIVNKRAAAAVEAALAQYRGKLGELEQDILDMKSRAELRKRS